MLEAGLFDIEAIFTGGNVHKLVQSLIARGLGTLFLRAGVSERDLSARHSRSRRIHHGAINGAESALAMKGK
jgi:hypothetical protein